jgi:hypothetical protein
MNRCLVLLGLLQLFSSIALANCLEDYANLGRQMQKMQRPAIRGTQSATPQYLSTPRGTVHPDERYPEQDGVRAGVGHKPDPIMSPFGAIVGYTDPRPVKVVYLTDAKMGGVLRYSVSGNRYSVDMVERGLDAEGDPIPKSSARMLEYLAEKVLPPNGELKFQADLKNADLFWKLVSNLEANPRLSKDAREAKFVAVLQSLLPPSLRGKPIQIQLVQKGHREAVRNLPQIYFTIAKDPNAVLESRPDYDQISSAWRQHSARQNNQRSIFWY